MDGIVDLHTHVLFDMDDGSDSIEESLDILKEAERSGVCKMALTPHFTIGDDVEEFLKERNLRFEELKKAAEEENIKISLKCGAEVYITDEIFNEDLLERLTIGESKVMLSEFKYNSLSAEKFLEYIDEIKDHGIIPLIAHPERYSYLRRNKMLLNAALSRGVLLQVNAQSLFERGDEGNFARMVVRYKAASVIGSDTHHTRSSRMGAIMKLNESEDDEICYLTETVPDMIFENSDDINDVEAELL
jgi:protein-tyrosine phosphatase